ncbi:MAG TPA: 30S ribosomal protein S12 methylthiotransferase RimO, partial [Phaeodactylibacter sp.]|nr:30S ribosomal protein S12 methylthiotransferase RimO [Phaeodactylibacter sp.]
AERRKKGELEKLYVTGCLSHRYKDELKREIPEVDAWFGTMELPAILERFSVEYRSELLGERPLMTLPHFAYLKIAEGCSRKCAFCAIPQMRGKHRSRAMEDILSEARRLAERGVKELMLISQELTFYGLDRYRRRALPDLLRKLARVEGIEWIRLHYAYPGQFPMELLDVMADEPKICPYLDLPLQHISEPVLQRMKRQTSRAEIEELVAKIREKLPGAALRTTFLTGFPGETEEDVQSLLEFVKRVRFERLGVFEYSHEEGTSAYALEDDVPPEEKTRRANLLMEVQREISLEINESRLGQTLKVVVDRELDDWYVGRTSWDSPEVDNEVWMRKNGKVLNPGSFADVCITDATEYDLYGDIL